MQPGISTLNDQLAGLQAAGRQMLAAARDGHWELAGECQASCHALAQAVFARPLSSADATAVAAAVNALLEMQNEVMDLCRESRAARLQELDGLNQGRQAVNEYSANSG